MVQDNYFWTTIFRVDEKLFGATVELLLVMRLRRMFRSLRLYDLGFRSIHGLPLPQRALTNLLITSILARLTRNDSIRVCSFVWMSNHVHMKLYSLDAEALSQFHQRLKKRLSDFLKRLLGLK
jgi:hypothetical protein